MDTRFGDVEMEIETMKDPLNQAYGIIRDGVPANTLVFTNFIGSVQGWYGKTPIGTPTSPGYYCNGTCEGIITSPGLDLNCSTTMAHLILTNPNKMETFCSQSTLLGFRTLSMRFFWDYKSQPGRNGQGIWSATVAEDLQRSQY